MLARILAAFTVIAAGAATAEAQGSDANRDRLKQMLEEKFGAPSKPRRVRSSASKRASSASIAEIGGGLVVDEVRLDGFGIIGLLLGVILHGVHELRTSLVEPALQFFFFLSGVF